ncbi:MAG: signal peptidase I [Sulfurovum sp.]|nr:signal peptidase I [Sulfurovum sp.]
MGASKPRSKILAFIFNAFIPGMGYFYVGHVKKSFLFLPFLALIHYSFISLFVYYVNPMLAIAHFMTILILYIFSLYHVIKIIRENNVQTFKINHWFITLIIFIPFDYILQLSITKFFDIRTFRLPVSSMSSTINKGDFLVAKKTKNILRGNVFIFEYPNDPSIYFVKRYAASENDEIIYYHKSLFIHFSEGDTYIQSNYPSESIIKLSNKLWVINPYMNDNKGIHYAEKEMNVFELLLSYAENNQSIGMTPKYIDGLESPVYQLHNNKMNAFYTKVQAGTIFMLGDNRENSNDSRIWGALPISAIYAEPKVIYFNFTNNFKIDWSRIGIKINKNSI